MAGYNRKKKDLESQQVALENDLEKLQIQAKSAGQFFKIFNREVLGVQRKMTKVRMRLRSMKIKKDRKYSERLSSSLPVFNSSIGQKINRHLNLSLQHFTDSDNNTLETITETTSKKIREINPEATPEIDEVDDEFEPTEFNLPHQRPYSKLLPAVALPHSEILAHWIWTRTVPRGLHPLDSESLLRGEINGNFNDVEDENLGGKIELLKTTRTRKPNYVKIPQTGAPPDLLKSEAAGCNCQRAIASIRCEGGCGFTIRGRLSIPCQAHPGRRHLMDHEPVCTQCVEMTRVVCEGSRNCVSAEDLDNNNTVIDPKYYGPNFCIIKPRLNVSKKLISSI